MLRQMNAIQKLVLIATTVAIIVLFLNPPFAIQVNVSGMETNAGYHFLFDPPRRGSLVGKVDIPTLLVQSFGILVVGVFAWLLAGTLVSRKKTKAFRPKFDPERAAQFRREKGQK